MFNREGTTVLVDSTVPDNISPVAYCPDNSWQQWLVLNFRTRKDCLVDGKRCLASTTLQTSISHTRSIWTPIHSQEGLGQTGSSVSVPRRFPKLKRTWFESSTRLKYRSKKKLKNPQERPCLLHYILPIPWSSSGLPAHRFFGSRKGLIPHVYRSLPEKLSLALVPRPMLCMIVRLILGTEQSWKVPICDTESTCTRSRI